MGDTATWVICFACRLHPSFAEGLFAVWAVPQAENLPLKVKVQKASIWTSLITKLQAVFLVCYYKGKSSDQHLGLKSGVKLAQKNVTALVVTMIYAPRWITGLLRVYSRGLCNVPVNQG